MIIGFLGKGGSGKSTLSTKFIKYLIDKKNFVLGIDGDHNMDLTFNLGVEDSFNYLGDAMDDLKEFSGLSKTANYAEVFLNDLNVNFSLNPIDSFSIKYTYKVNDNLSLMASGPHTDKVLFGQSCSHTLSTPLKVYLPLLNLNSNEFVVIDEKAGRDGAGTGIPTGYHFAFIIVEPTLHGVKAANQIADLLDFFQVNYEFIFNKVPPKLDLTIIENKLKKNSLTLFNFNLNSSDPFSSLSELENNSFTIMEKRAKESLDLNGDKRVVVTKEKFVKNREYAS